MKVIKELMIILLTCLVGILLFAVVFYEYIPSRKVVAEVKEYKASEKVKELMADDVENRNDQIVLTYKVTSSDLNNYKVTKDYVPGKANPFAAVSQDPETNATPKKSTDKNETSNSTSNSSTSENTNSLIEDKGTK